jgi:hypothetical protein
MSNKKYHYTYYSYEEWGMGYFGSRSCNCLPEEDLNYFGSFKDKSFKPTQKIILKDDYATRKDAMRDEVILHNYYDVAANPHFANRAKQTSTRFTQAGVSPSEETRKKLSKAGKGKKRSEETRKKMSQAFRGKFVSEETKEKVRQANLGKKLSPETIRKREETRRERYKNAPKKVLSEETKRKISQTLTGRKIGPFSEEHKRKISEANKGKTFIMSEEAKKKISETMKGKHSGEKNPFYGKKHSEETRKKISAIHKGRKITEEEREKRLNRMFINNGEKSTLIKKDQPIPEGWVRGRLTKQSKSLINNSSK